MIYANPKMEHVEEIINFLVENKIFLHLKIVWKSLDSSITSQFLQEQIDRYTPSIQHGRNCKGYLCYKKARLEFIDSDGFVTNFKTFKDQSLTEIFFQAKYPILIFAYIFLFICCFVFVSSFFRVFSHNS